ncbi:protein cereblon [Musca vetustissima]|uniref:protein cereblon n=1 Tax=Musca vetustissima TaxID=27455 RepID=UPI002AB76823|nr:protein cereblon [Musca vetustissima]
MVERFRTNNGDGHHNETISEERTEVAAAASRSHNLESKNPTEEEQQQNEQQLEEAGIDPNYPLVVASRVSIPSNNDANQDESSAMEQDNVPVGDNETSSNVNVSSDFANIPERAVDDDSNLDSWPENNENEAVNQNVHQNETESMLSEERTSEAAAPVVVPSRSHSSESNSITGDAAQPAEEQQQNEQQIEEAGIDPNYPLVLVRRVSLPSNNDGNQDEPSAMEQDNAASGENDEPSMVEIPPNVLDLFHIDQAERNDDANAPERAEDEDSDLDSWSEDNEDEAAIIENPNLREFSNHFVVIRNMIAQTRRSMAEAEANMGPSEILPQIRLMQRFRRILFILNNRRRRLIRLGMNTPDEENPEAEANAEMEAVNDEIAAQQNADDQQRLENNQSEENEEGSMSMEQEDEMEESAVRFDTNLPAEHSYLGPNMNRVSGVNYLDADQYIKLRLFLHHNVLFPGEVLPFMVDSSTTITDGDIDAQNGILFGVCFPTLTNNNSSSTSNADRKNDHLLYGVTCQIYELGTDDRGNTLIKSRALQRFVTKVNDLTVPMEYITAHPRMKCHGFVKILPDIYLPEPFKQMNMGSMNRFRDNASMQIAYRRFQAASTPWPAHVYEAHNMDTIIEKARQRLEQHKIDTMPSDPTQLSYWLVRNLHLPEKMLKSVFLANTVNTRLKLIASTFKEDAVYICRTCGAHIANCRELFAMSKHGVQSQYCNSAGYIHETNTVYHVNRQNILYSGSPSTEFSWFPGYQWHIIVCKICEHHLGWEFKAVEPNLRPKLFFGISSSSVRIRSASEHANDNDRGQNTFYHFIRLMNAGVNIE